MAPAFSRIQDITVDDDETLKIQVRVIRMWYTKSSKFSNEVGTIDLVLLDQEESKIQATVTGRQLIAKHKPVFHEGRCYIIQNFHIGLNEGKFLPTQHKFRINFNWSTNVRPCEANIPNFGFDFISFDDILQKKVSEKCLIDVIGELDHYQPITRWGISSKKMQIVLKDSSGMKVNCTLWDDFGEEMTRYISGTSESSIIVVMQLARTKRLSEHVIVTTSLNATKVMFNPNIPAVEDFKQRLNLTEITTSQRFSQVSMYPGSSIGSQSIIFENKKSLIEIRNCEEVTKCSALATVYKIQSNYSWFYESCNSCRKKIQPKDDGLWCYNCNLPPTSTTARYRVQLMVMDDSGPASFVLFDNDVMQFTKKTASELREALIRDDNEYGFPPELNVFKSKKLLFNVEISEYNIRNRHRNWEENAFKVLFISENEEQMKKFETQLKPIEELASTGKSIYNADSVPLSLSEAPKDDLLPAFDKEADTSPSNTVTPQKRIDIIEDSESLGLSDILTPQMSSTKNLKKIKTEKVD